MQAKHIGLGSRLYMLYCNFVVFVWVCSDCSFLSTL